MRLRIFLSTLLLLLVALNINAQVYNSEEVFKERATEKVGTFCRWIAYVANPQNGYSNRASYKQRILNLFVGKGYDYEEDGVNKKGVRMEVTSVTKGTKTEYFVREYIDNLLALKYYTKVDIKTTDIADMKVSRLHKISDNEYVCTVYITQAFSGFRDGKAIYRDITNKRVKCYVIVEHTEEGDEFITRLGDVTADETKTI